jgi:predicted acylesterase/phospholipase RssA
MTKLTRRTPHARLVTGAIACLLAFACAGGPPPGVEPLAPRGATPVGFSSGIRTEMRDFDFNKEGAPRAVHAIADRTIDMLALSGGGAGGAYGAGVLVGLTNAGTRPRFEIVTGVSTGALIAPFAFLGSDWDRKLTEAYGGEATDKLMQARGLGVLFDVGVFDGKPLRDLVERFVTEELVFAVAREAANGRMLLVATTNLDREETVLWDMGAIARRGGPQARDLFRQVLVASASVPGVFPPVMIEVEKDGEKFKEMHVDGGASTPFFIAPESLMHLDEASASLRGANVYVIINGQVASAPRSTSNNTLDIAARSFTSVLNQMTRTAILQTDDFARRNSLGYRFSGIPSDVEFGGSLAFDKVNMSATFDYGVRCATRGQVWLTEELAAARMREDADLKPFAEADCPLIPRKSG